MNSPIKYIFVSGGVISGVGKGVISASVALLLQESGIKTSLLKCENYLNIDSGLINPVEHGDVFLCDDGTEADMDLGTYERFLNQNMGKDNFLTMGQIYRTVIDKERNFEYKGEDVEAIPHVTDEIIRRIKESAAKQKVAVLVVELGGTAGEYQNALFYEAARIMALRDKNSVLHIHVAYMPTPYHLGEPKTKPVQFSIKDLNSMGIQPDFLIARSHEPVDAKRNSRFALFCNLSPDDIISAPDLKTPYEMPLLLHQRKLEEKIIAKLSLTSHSIKLDKWAAMIHKIKAPKQESVRICIIAKYIATGDYQLKDSYASLLEAINHAAWSRNAEAKITFVNAESFTKQAVENADGIIVPIGWGPRGVDGMIDAIKYARENKIPYLGLCYGMQLACLEYARHVIGLKDADTTENNPHTNNPIIYLIPDQEKNVTTRAYGGTMRLGAWACQVKKNTLAYSAYNQELISERHRHRYEFNKQYMELFVKNGFIFSGFSLKEKLVEIVELPQSQHPFFLGIQGHPEYKSHPLSPHPLFVKFLQACQNKNI